MKRKILFIIIAICALACLLLFTGCNGDCNGSHEYTIGECIWGDDIATVVLTCEKCGEELKEETTIVKTNLQDEGCTWIATVSIGGNTYNEFRKSAHSYGDVSYSWSKDHSTCTATRVCSFCHGKLTETVDTAYSVIKASTCTKEGECCYTSAEFTKDKLFKVQKKYESIAKAPHSVPVSDVSYSWVDDSPTESTCTASYTCQQCHSKIKVEQKGVPGEENPKQTCFVNGVVLYTAKFDDKRLGTDYYRRTIPAAHLVTETITWSEDFQTCTAVRTCSRCPLNITETVTLDSGRITVKEHVDAHCETDGHTTYEATFVNFTKKTTTDTHEKTGHTFGETTYTWSEKHDTCSAQKICSVCNKSVFDKATSEQEILVAPECSHTGLSKYTATFANNNGEDFEKQTVQVDIDSLPHTFVKEEVSYDWNEVESCTASGTCTLCHQPQSETKAPAAPERTLAPTCTEKGNDRYTVEFDKGFEPAYTDKEVPEKGHTFADPETVWEVGENAYSATCKSQKTCTVCEHVEIVESVDCTGTGVVIDGDCTIVFTATIGESEEEHSSKCPEAHTFEFTYSIAWKYNEEGKLVFVCTATRDCRAEGCSSLISESVTIADPVFEEEEDEDSNTTTYAIFNVKFKNEIFEEKTYKFELVEK